VKIKTLFLETRPHFLLLTPTCLSVGFASAWHDGFFNFQHLVLALIGVLLLHVSVNVLNDYFDYKRGTDLLTVTTPFSGGSGFLPSGSLDPEQVYKLGLISLAIASVIGCYFVCLYPILLPIIVIAAFSVYFYTPLLTRLWIAEIFPGLNFGPLAILGAYITQLPANNLAISPVPFLASIPVGLLVSNLLFLNELPDYEADYRTGRRHAVILLGRRKASKVYVFILMLTYISIAVPAILGLLPIYVMISFITIPIAMKSSIIALKNYDRIEELIPAMRLNVITTLMVPLLITLGLLIS